MRLKALSFIYCVTVMACGPARHVNDTQNRNVLQSHIDSVGNMYAPDKRTTWFRITANGNIIKGETNAAAAKQALLSRLDKEGIHYIDSILVLPSPGVGNKTKAIVTISVANIRVQPSHKAELATQATMGTPVKVWKRERGWYLVQTPDDYLGWVDNEAIAPMDSAAFTKWMDRPKVIFTEAYGMAYEQQDHSSPVTDLVYGNVMTMLKDSTGFIHVQLPDGRRAAVLAWQCMDYRAWKQTRKPEPDSIVKSARQLMGVPYLWGGTSFKGVDCSGFTKTVYFMNGMVLPRDASQQALLGTDINTTNGWQELKPGDLLFFGSAARDTTPERVVHVGIWIGNHQFIHASGKVQVASVDPSAPNYDAGEHKRFLRARRITPETALMDIRYKDLY